MRVSRPLLLLLLLLTPKNSASSPVAAAAVVPPLVELHFSRATDDGKAKKI